MTCHLYTTNLIKALELSHKPHSNHLILYVMLLWYCYSTACWGTNKVNGVILSNRIPDNDKKAHHGLTLLTLNFIFSVVWTEGKKRMKEDHSHMHTLPFCHTSRPVRLRVALSAAYSELLENTVLPIFSLGLFMLCLCEMEAEEGHSRMPVYVWVRNA